MTKIMSNLSSISFIEIGIIRINPRRRSG